MRRLYILFITCSLEFQTAKKVMHSDNFHIVLGTTFISMLSYSAVAKSLSSVIPDKVVNINRVSSKDCRDTALFRRSKLSEIANLKNYNVNANRTSFSFNHLPTPSAIILVRCL